MDRFRYQVTPFSPINNLFPGKSVRVPFSADLTKEEVLLCMKKGPVYRIMPNGQPPVRITGSNLDQYHRDLTKKETKKVIPSIETVEEEKPIIQNTDTLEDPKVEASTEQIVEEKQETVEKEPFEPVEIEIINDIQNIEETVQQVESEEEEEIVEEVSEEIETIPLATTVGQPRNNQQNFNYNKKKKHH